MLEGRVYRFMNGHRKYIFIKWAEIYVDVYEVTIRHKTKEPPYEEFKSTATGKTVHEAMKKALQHYNSTVPRGCGIGLQNVKIESFIPY